MPVVLFFVSSDESMIGTTITPTSAVGIAGVASAAVLCIFFPMVVVAWWRRRHRSRVVHAFVPERRRQSAAGQGSTLKVGELLPSDAASVAAAQAASAAEHLGIGRFRVGVDASSTGAATPAAPDVAQRRGSAQRSTPEADGRRRSHFSRRVARIDPSPAEGSNWLVMPARSNGNEIGSVL